MAADRGWEHVLLLRNAIRLAGTSVREVRSLRKEAFRAWLYGRIMQRSISDALSRCSRVENAFKLDLDAEYHTDRGRAVLNSLEYTVDDERLNRPAPPQLEFKEGANIKEGMASLRSAVRTYCNFCRSTEGRC